MRSKLPRILNAYVFAICAAAALMLLLADFELPVDRTAYWNTFAAFVGLGLLAEVFSLHVRAGSATTAAVSFVPYLAGILLLGPASAMMIAGVTELFAETIIRRKPLIKVLHNTAAGIIAVGAAGILYFSVGPVPSFDTFEAGVVPAFVISAITYFVLNNGAVATAVALESGTDVGEAWRESVGKGLLYDVLSSPLALLLAFLYVNLQVLGLLLVIVPLFFVRHAHHANLQLEQTNRDLLDLMVKSIEARDPYTSGHSVRVAMYAKALARALNLPSKEVEQIETAALLHDVGKIHEDYAPILRKSGKLTPSEKLLMHSHPARSADLVATISSLQGYVEHCVRHHHEHYDGGGYPDGLAGDRIPIGARIVMIADTSDAMTTDRSYREALNYDRLLAELERYSGSQFDPALVTAFRRCRPIRRIVEEVGPRIVAELPARLALR